MGVRIYPDVPRVYIDMDGPMANFEAALESSGLPVKDFKCQPGVYRGLPLTKLALASIAKIEEMGVLVFMLTKIPLSNPLAATEKLLYVQEHAPRLLDRVIISPDKGAVGTPRDFLVEDHPDWANANNFPGTLLFWHHNWPEIVATIRNTLTLRQLEVTTAEAPAEADSINQVLEREDSAWRVADAQSIGGPFLRLVHATEREPNGDPVFIAALPHGTPAGVIVAMSAVAGYYFRKGSDSMVPE